MFSTFLYVYGDIGFGTLVLSGTVVGVIALARLAGRSRSAARPNVDRSVELCPRCQGRRRFVAADGREWPCLERAYRHDDGPATSNR
jgi:hypothetical protein